MHVCGAPNFTHLAKIGERMERDFKDKLKIQEPERRNYPQRRGRGPSGEVAIVSHNASGSASSEAQPRASGDPKVYQPKKKFPPRNFTPLPRPLSQLLPMLLDGHLVAKEVPRNNPPRFNGFDESKSCIYHMGEKGHDVDNCLTLKIKVQNLIDRGLLNFKEPEPNVHQNPLPEHQEVNVIEGDDSDDEYEAWKERCRRADRKFIEEARANGETVAALAEGSNGYRYMVKITPPPWTHDPNLVITPDGWGGLDDLEQNDRKVDDLVKPKVEIEAELESKLKIETDQDWEGEVIDKHVVYCNGHDVTEQLRGEDREERATDTILSAPPFDPHYYSFLRANARRRLQGETSSSAYAGQAVRTEGQVREEMEVDNDHVATITPVVIQLPSGGRDQHSSSGMKPMVITLAEQMSQMSLDADKEACPNTIELPPRPSFDTKAVPWDYGTSGVSAITRSGRCYAPRQEGAEKKAVTEEDAKQVLSLIRTSEFEVIEQLRKMPAQISLLELFKNSEKHKNALMKVLNEVHVPETIDEGQLENFVATILLKDQILYSDEDYPEEGRSHNKPLYIAVKCSGKEVPRVLIDNGSAFNLCSLNTLRQIGKEKVIRTSTASIRSFDGVKKEVVGEAELEVTIGPVIFLINFQVVDIQSSFNFLLGRPWIHTAGAVPSSLHQKVRFVVDGKLITVHGEMGFVGHLGDDVPYVHPGSTEGGEYAYYSLQLIHAVHTPAGTIMRSPQLSKSSIMTGKVLMENGFEPGKGLGKYAQGIAEPITIRSTTARRGLGFQGEVAKPRDPTERSGRRGRGRGNQGRHGGRSIDPNLWKGKTKEVRYHEIPLEYTFPGPPKWLQDEDVHSATEDDLPPLSEEDFVNVIISAKNDVPALE